MYLDRKSTFATIMLVVTLTLVSLAVTYLLVQGGIIVAPIVIIALVGMGVVGSVLKSYKIGVYLLFALAGSMFYIDRIFKSPVPLGVVFDGLIALVFIAFFVNNKEKNDWTFFKHPITIVFILLTVYQVLQVFNPDAVSFTGWLVAMRNNTSLLLFIVCCHMFTRRAEVKRFTIAWVALAAFAALYGIYQEVFGLTDFETRWVYSSPARVDLLFIWGHMRKFSILSDPSAFGMFMAFSGLACLILAIGPFPGLYRLIFVGLAAIMFISMSFSGTRTSIAMVAVGVVFYIVVSMRNRKTMIAAVMAGVATVLVLFGPFHGGTINRIRSTFNPSEDASMSVRDVKRVRLQPYIHAHPFGGGLNTTGTNGVRYSAGHYLAGGWDPDSGYLMTALELGWIGLILGMTFFFLVILRGINNYFSINDPLLKTLVLAYIVPFLALSVAHFTQDAMFQKPVNMVIVVTYALMIRMPSLEKKLIT
jgi:hypothetical protein